MTVEKLPLVSTLGVILAGGRSSRMGVDKSTLQLSGASFLEQAIKRFSELGISNYVISSNRIDGALTDRLPQIGPLGALDALMHRADRLVGVDSIVVVPIDMPLFPADGIKQLCEYGNEKQTSCYYQNHPMPFFIWLDACFVQILTKQIDAGILSVRALLEKLSAQELKYANEQQRQNSFFNVNTPEQMQQIQSWLQT